MKIWVLNFNSLLPPKNSNDLIKYQHCHSYWFNFCLALFKCETFWYEYTVYLLFFFINRRMIYSFLIFFYESEKEIVFNVLYIFKAKVFLFVVLQSMKFVDSVEKVLFIYKINWKKIFFLKYMLTRNKYRF